MLKTLIYTIYLELKLYLRIPMSLFWIIAFPLLQLFLFGALFGGFSPVQVEIGIADAERSPVTQALVENLAQVHVLKIHTGSYEELKAQMERGRLRGLVVIPSGFTANLATRQARLQVYYNPVEGALNEIFFAVMNETLRVLNEKYAPDASAVRMDKQSLHPSLQQVQYVHHLLPGLIGFCIVSVAIFSIAIPMATAREKNYLKRISVTPVPKSLYIFSFVGAGWLIALVQSGIIFMTGRMCYDIGSLGSYWQLFLLLNLGIGAFMSIGVFVATISPTVVTANILGSMIFFPMIFLSEVYFPIANLPLFLQQFVQCFPLIHFLQVFRKIMLEGSSLWSFSQPMVILSLWIVIPAILAYKFFSWTARSN